MTDEQTRVFSVIKHIASAGKGLTPGHARLLVELAESLQREEGDSDNNDTKSVARGLRQELVEARAASHESELKAEAATNLVGDLERDLQNAKDTAAQNEDHYSEDRGEYKDKVADLNNRLSESAAKAERLRDELADVRRGHPAVATQPPPTPEPAPVATEGA